MRTIDTTRTAGPRSRAARPAEYLLTAGQEIRSPETRVRYRVGRFLGQGGFGQLFLASVVGTSDLVPAEVCIKVSPHADAWIREAYFGLQLREHPRAIQVYDRFPLTRADGTVLYCLVLECAAAASRPHADERLRVRRPSPQARRLRHRPPAERPPGRHRSHDDPDDRTE